MRPNVDGQAQDRTGVVAHERVHRNHLQIQHVLSGAVHSTGENKHGADVVDLLRKQIRQAHYSKCGSGRNQRGLLDYVFSTC